MIIKKDSLFATQISHVSAQQARDIDLACIKKAWVPTDQLMTIAAWHLARLSNEYIKRPSRIAVLAGKGHNGADALLAAMYLSNWGHQVSIFLMADIQEYKGLSFRQLSQVKVAPGCRVLSRQDFDLDSVDLVIDGLLGVGLKLAARPPIVPIINQLNHANVPVISVDIPSGLDASDGPIHSPIVKATMTVTFALPKIGFLKDASKSYLGDVFLVDIGVPPHVLRQFNCDQRPPFHQNSVFKIEY
ncbi:MAG: NAD(P)H-hydrate epimerase [Actinobacteria bacterium]|nr:NAD(P)H-hydrate epimerase [Actinomycetota bacterium]